MVAISYSLASYSLAESPWPRLSRAMTRRPFFFSSETQAGYTQFTFLVDAKPCTSRIGSPPPSSREAISTARLGKLAIGHSVFWERIGERRLAIKLAGCADDRHSRLRRSRHLLSQPPRLL